MSSAITSTGTTTATKLLSEEDVTTEESVAPEEGVAPEEVVESGFPAKYRQRTYGCFSRAQLPFQVGKKNWKDMHRKKLTQNYPLSFLNSACPTSSKFL